MLDPMYDQWEADFQTANQDEFLKVLWESSCCDVFVDEAGEAIGQYNKVMQALATRGRHWGHNCYFLCQRAAMVSPTVRTQCRILFAFNQAREDADILAREWGYDELRECPKLAQGKYFQASRFGGIQRGNAFD